MSKRIFAQAVIQHDNAQSVEQLTLVLVDSLYLGIEHRLRIDRQARRGLQPGCELCFAFLLRL